MGGFNARLVTVAVMHQLPVVSAGIVAALSAHADMHVVEESEHPEEPIDVCVTDFGNGLHLASKRALGARVPKLLILTDSDREDAVRAAFRAGINGYLLYDCKREEIINAVVALGRGERHFCARVVARMADSFTHDSLTPRELDVLSLMIKGCNNKLIARELNISLGTVKAHANAVYGKLNASSRLQAVAVAVARGIGSSELAHRVVPHASSTARHPPLRSERIADFA